MESDEQRYRHYKSQWHRYNVKRKCKGLPPTTEDTFQRMLEAASPNQDSAKESKLYMCTLCSVKYRSKGALDTHLSSKKHKKAAACSAQNTDNTKECAVAISLNPPEEHDEDQENTPEPEAIPVGCCLFCNHEPFPSVEDCVSHMNDNHGFILPYQDYLTNMDGLLEYLGFKVGMGFQCLGCRGSGSYFGSLQAVRNHMIDKGHCMVGGDYNDEDFEFDLFYEIENSTERYPVSMNELGELVLNDGTLIGTKDLALAYNQEVRMTTARRSQKPIARFALTYRSHQADAKMIRDQKVQQHQQSKYAMKLGVKRNRLQTHFREQVLF